MEIQQLNQMSLETWCVVWESVGFFVKVLDFTNFFRLQAALGQGYRIAGLLSGANQKIWLFLVSQTREPINFNWEFKATSNFVYGEF